MPYISQTLRGSVAKEAAGKMGPFEPCMPEDAHRVEKLELVCSSFDDPGDDWTEWRAYRDDGTLLRSRRMSGF